MEMDFGIMMLSEITAPPPRGCIYGCNAVKGAVAEEIKGLY